MLNQDQCKLLDTIGKSKLDWKPISISSHNKLNPNLKPETFLELTLAWTYSCDAFYVNVDECTITTSKVILLDKDGTPVTNYFLKIHRNNMNVFDAIENENSEFPWDNLVKTIWDNARSQATKQDETCTKLLTRLLE